MAPARVHATAFTHQGAVRAGNEDTIAVGDWIRSAPMAAPVVLEHTLAAPLICLVADGMGGQPAGEVASRSVAERLSRRAAEATDEAAVARLLHEANDALFARMNERPACYGMGATVAGVALAPSGVLAFNVGDSRVYRVEADGLVQLSTDDTPGPKLPDGRTGLHELNHHPGPGRLRTRSARGTPRAARPERAFGRRRALSDLQRRPDGLPGADEDRGTARGRDPDHHWRTRNLKTLFSVALAEDR